MARKKKSRKELKEERRKAIVRVRMRQGWTPPLNTVIGGERYKKLE